MKSISQDLQSSPLFGPTATDVLTYALSKFVAIPSVSSEPSHKEDCRQTAIWLRKCLSQLGARTSLVRRPVFQSNTPDLYFVIQLPTGEGNNPLVLATFHGTSGGQQRKPRVLFYGCVDRHFGSLFSLRTEGSVPSSHYDVISAPPNGWKTDPFTVTGQNGYLYGRGVTDNKGPILAAACAAADLLSRRALGLDLVMLIEGEEECGSIGFGDAVRKHRVSRSTYIFSTREVLTDLRRMLLVTSMPFLSGEI